MGDRAYFSYDFINYLDKKNIYYVIRTKNNSLYLDKNKNNKKTNLKKLDNESWTVVEPVIKNPEDIYKPIA